MYTLRLITPSITCCWRSDSLEEVTRILNYCRALYPAGRYDILTEVAQ